MSQRSFIASFGQFGWKSKKEIDFSWFFKISGVAQEIWPIFFFLKHFFFTNILFTSIFFLYNFFFFANNIFQIRDFLNQYNFHTQYKKSKISSIWVYFVIVHKKMHFPYVLVCSSLLLVENRSRSAELVSVRFIESTMFNLKVQ